MGGPWTPEQADDLNAKLKVCGDRVEGKVTTLEAAVIANHTTHSDFAGTMRITIDDIKEKITKTNDSANDAFNDLTNFKVTTGDEIKKLWDRLMLAEQALMNTQTEARKSAEKIMGIEQQGMSTGGTASVQAPPGIHMMTGGHTPGGGKEFVDLKQMRPEKLKTAEEFRPWRKAFENFCELVEQGMKEVLKKIGNQRKELTEMEMRAVCGGKDKEELDRRLHNALLGYTEGEAKRLVEAAGAGQGLKAYQELCMYYDLKTDASENRLMCELLGMASKPAKNLKEVRQLMVEMEAKRMRLEEMGGEVPRPKSLRAILVGLLDEETKKHIGDAIGGLEYHEAKKRVNDHVTTNLETGSGGCADDMDLGRCGKEEHKTEATEEKEGEKENENEEGWDARLAALKGSGKGCYACGKPGHFARECWTKGLGKGGPKGGWQAPGKGGEGAQAPKGKGKGKGPKTGCWQCGGAHYANQCPQGQATKGKGKGKGLYALPDEGWGAWQEPQWPTYLCCLRTGCQGKKSAFAQLAELEQKEDEECERMLKDEEKMMDSDEEAMKDEEDNMGEHRLKAESHEVSEGGWTGKVRKKNRRGRKGQRVGVLRVEQDEGLKAVKQTGGWKKVRFTVDSGAGETVMNKDELPGVPIMPSAGSKRGQHYVTASDERIPNEGEQKFLAKVTAWNRMQNGSWIKNDEVNKGVKVQIADISHPLMAVKSLCLANHRVVFDEDGSYAQNKETGEIIEIAEDKGEYVLDMWVQDGEQEQGFMRQGQ